MDQHPLPRFALPGDWSEPWCTLALSAPTAIPANCSMVPGAIEKPTQQSALSRNPILDRTLKRVSVDACSWLELQRAPVGDDAVTRLVSDCRVGVARARARTRHCTARTRARTLPTARSRVGRHAAHGSRHARRASGVDCPTK
jgi:hypothetical protein